MLFTVDQLDFIGGVGAVASAVEPKASSPICGLIRMQVDAKGIVISATNLDFGCKIRVPAEVEKEGSIVINAKKLHDWLKLLAPGGTVKVRANERLSFSCGKSNCNLSFLEDATFPNFPKKGKLLATIESEIFAALLSDTYSSIGIDDDYKFNYSGLLLESNSGLVRAVATEGHRLGYSQSSSVLIENDFRILVPRKAIHEVSSVVRGSNAKVQLFEAEGNVLFLVNRKLIYTRTLQVSQFPKWEAVFKQASGWTITADSKALLDCVKRVSTQAAEDSKKLIIEVNPGRLSVSATSDIGDSQEEIEVESSESATFAVNSSWISDTLKIVGEGKVEIRPLGNLIEFRRAGSDGYRGLIATMSVG